MRIFALLILASFLVVSCTSDFGKILKSKDHDYQLKKANEFFYKKNYRQAEQLYVELFPIFKGTEKFEELYYKYAYCSYFQKNYADAENLFKGFLEVFPSSAKEEEISFVQANSYYLQSPPVDLEQTNTMKAIGMMQTFINTHPGSSRIKSAIEIIDKGRAKLEVKQYKAAALYYKIQHYRAAGLAFADLLNSYPESSKGDEYKLLAIKSFYEFAKLSVVEKQLERFEKVISEYNDFTDRYPESKLLKEALTYNNLSLNHIKEIQNEQIKTTTKR